MFGSDGLLIVKEDFYHSVRDCGEDVRRLVRNADGFFQAEDLAIELQAGFDVADYQIGREFRDLHGFSSLFVDSVVNWDRELSGQCVCREGRLAHTSGVLASPPSTTLARKDVGRDPHCPTIIVGGARTNRRAGPARYGKNNITRVKRQWPVEQRYNSGS